MSRRRSLPESWRALSPQTRLAIGAALLLGLALAVRVGYVLHTDNYVPTKDAASYDLLAHGLAKGHGWLYGASAYVPPGYPFFLAGVYKLIGLPTHVWTGARLFQALLATGTIALVGSMALQLAGRRAMLIALALGALYLPLVLVGVALITESLFVPLMLAATNCALRSRVAARRYRWIAAAGFFCGLASLTRGNGLVLGPALAALVWTGAPRRSRRALAAPAALLAVMALTISPWTIRNAIALHHFVPVTTEAGLTLAGTYNDHSARTRFMWHFDYPNYRAIKNDKHQNDALKDERLTSAVVGYIGLHPAYVPEAMFWNTLRLMDLQGRRVSRMTARNDVRASAGWSDLAVVSFWILAVVAIVGAFTRAARRVSRVVWLTPGLLWLSVAPVTTGTPRFRAALDPFVILLAALAIEAAASALRVRRASVDELAVAA